MSDIKRIGDFTFKIGPRTNIIIWTAFGSSAEDTMGEIDESGARIVHIRAGMGVEVMQLDGKITKEQAIDNLRKTVFETTGMDGLIYEDLGEMLSTARAEWELNDLMIKKNVLK